MRRTVATLLVVASPVLMVVPADAGGNRAAQPAAPVPVTVPAAPDVVAPPAAPAMVMGAVPTPANPVAAVRRVERTLRAKAPAVAPAVAPVADTAYAARLQAELCQARAVFCGLDRHGRYPAG